MKYLDRLSASARHIAATVVLMLTAIVATSGASAQIARTEILAVQSMTLTDEQFLTGRKDGKPVMLGGLLRLPAGTGRVPAVVLLHGSGGISGYVTDWEMDFNALGMATFVVDSFSARGLNNTNVDQFALGRLAMMVDAYRSLEVLAKHPRIDPARIVLMGFSRGGQSALYASVKRFQSMHGPASLEFAAYIPLYPACMTIYRGDENVADKPIRVFHGSADNYNPVAACREYAARLKGKARDFQLTEYEGAGHVFDGKAFRNPIVGATWQTFRNCRLAEAQDGLIINTKTGQPHTAADPCIELGPTVAYNANADTEVRKAVADLMKSTVKAN